MKKFVILCKRHQKKVDYVFTFWKNGGGYTFDLTEAEQVSEEEVLQRFPKSHWSDDFPISLKQARQLQELRVVERRQVMNVIVNNSHNRKELGVDIKEFLSVGSVWTEGLFEKPETFLEATKRITDLREDVKDVLYKNVPLSVVHE